MQLGPNSIAQAGLGGYRASASRSLVQYRPLGVTIDWSTVAPIGGKNAKGTLVVTAGAGNITFTYGNQTTGNVAYNADAATIEAALEGLSSIGNGNIRIAGATPNFTYELIEDLRHAARDATFTSTGATMTETQAGAADVDETLPGGLVAKVGERVLRAGSTIYRLNSGLYGVAGSATNLVRGACYVVDRHYFKSLDLDQIGDVFDSGVAYRARLLLDGAGQVTETNFLAAFPGVRILRD